MTGSRARTTVPSRLRATPVHGRPVPAPGTRSLALVLAAAGLLAVALGVLAAQGRLLLHPCVTADGPLGQLGVRLALLSSANDCPEGTLAVSDAATNGAILVLSVAAPVLVAHLVAAVSGAGLTALLVRAASSAAALLGVVLVRLPARPRALARPSLRPLVSGPDVRPPSTRGLRAHPHRGPPLAAV